MGKRLGTGYLLQRKMPKEQERTSLIWFTKNLRIRDNKALSEALKNSDRTTAVYCVDPHWFQISDMGFPKMGRFRAKFLLESLEDLSLQLSELGIPFHVLIGNLEEEIARFIYSNNISKVFFQKEWTSEEASTLESIKSKCNKSIAWHSYFDQFLIHPEELPFDISELPFLFTEFRKKVEKNLIIRSEIEIKSLASKKKSPKAELPSLASLGFDDTSSDDRTAFPFIGGETEANKRLQHYFWESDAIQSYKETRNGLLGIDYSSKFSPWLANGSISARTIYHGLKRYEEERGSNQSTYWLIFELLWRDFFKYVSLKYGNRIFHSKGIRSKKKTWKQDLQAFKKWREGKTDSPFVNANLKELNATGWMSNRGRQNVASYLTKTMGIDWRWGAAYFESLLVDYDVHSNYGNWMYVAGVGNDPRDRYFNVTKQAQMYDPERHYQELWLKEQHTV